MTAGTIMAHLLQSAILLAVGWAIYKFALSHVKMPAFNRAVILGIYIISLCAPVLIPNISNIVNTDFGHNTTVLTNQSISYKNDFTESALITQPVTNNSIITASNSDTSAHHSNIISHDNKTTFELTFVLRIVCAGAIAGTVTLLLYMLTGLISIMRLSFNSKHISIGRIKLILLNENNISPFSIFNRIFISHNDMNSDADMIIEHEMEHIRKMHSFDLLLSHGCMIAMWWNPAAWLLNRELRAVHEYQADAKVLNNGHKVKDYQLLLIKKAAGTKLQSVSSSLNQSKLKKRFTMMYQKNPSRWAKLRATTLIPAFLLAVMLTGQKSFASIISEISSISLLENNIEVEQAVITETNNNVTNKHIALQHNVQEESTRVVTTCPNEKSTATSESVDNNITEERTSENSTITINTDGDIVKINNITGDTIYHYMPNKSSSISKKEREEIFNNQKLAFEKQKQEFEKQKREFDKQLQEFDKQLQCFDKRIQESKIQQIKKIKQQIESVKQQKKSVRKQFADVHGVDVKNLTDDMLSNHERSVLESIENTIKSLESTAKSLERENKTVRSNTNSDFPKISGSKIITAKVLNADNINGSNLRILLTSNKPIKVERATLIVNGKRNKCSISTDINVYEQHNKLYKCIVDVNTSKQNKTFTPDDIVTLTTNLATISIKNPFN